ncbi:MAG: 50S ribosomal protein L13 [Thermanaerothrix sp.]|nr:50S ribosomal protein L13 [Thermanaerothrix sp.]
MIGTRSFMAKKEAVERKWYVVDATDKHLGRLASRIALVLSGKHRPTYTPHVDTGDFVVVINAEKVGLTGKKREQSMVHRFSGYSGGLKSVSYGKILDQNPEKLIERVVKGMLPKNRLGRAMFKKLKVYAGPTHPHGAQKPETLEL